MNSDILHFNFSCIDYADKSWLNRFDKFDVIEKSASSKRVKKRISDMLLDRIGLSHRFIFEIDSQSKRIINLSSKQLVDSLYMTGCVVYSRIVRDVIDGKKILELKEIIGSENYDFAIRRAPYIKHSLSSLHISERFDMKKLGEQILSLGIDVFSKSLINIDRVIYKRILLKLPIDIYKQTSKPTYKVKGDVGELYFTIIGEIQNVPTGE